VNISTEDTPHDGTDNNSSPAAVAGIDLQQNDTTTQEFATATATSSSKRVDGSMSPCIEEQDYTYSTNDNMNIDEDDRKPAAKPSNPSSNNTSNNTSNSKSQVQKVDNRFTCAICLENVSDEPVVTKCGHLYCWSCLYQWLEPGMMLSEYNSAFGGGNTNANMGSSNYNAGSRSYNVGMGIRNSSIESNSSSGGLNFLSTSYQTTTNIQHQQQSAMYNDRPYNPSGGQFSQRKFEQRRHCPVCKASCTVDSVIPIYLTGLGSGGSVNGDDSSMVGSVSLDYVGDTAGHEEARDSIRRRQSIDSLDSLDVDNNIPTVSAAQSSLFATSTTNVATTPDGSPSNTPATDTLLAMQLEDPTNSNLGLRQRRRGRGTKRSSPSTTTSDNNANLKRPPEQLKQPPEQQKYECKSPTRTSDTSGILDSEYRRQQDNANNNNLASHDNTPIHRNSIDFVDGINNNNGMDDTSGRSASNVPSRPIPNYPMQPQNTPMSQPDLINDHTTLNESISPNMTQSALSSPFRLALRPRHPSLSMGGGGGGAHHQQRPATHAHRQGQSYSQMSYAHSHHRHHGRLTSALLGIVDTIDNLANNSTSGATGHASAAPAASVVPTLHRSDGGMGGIGRASEVHQNGYVGNGGDPTMMMSEEESSLANAREFLSRLLLMLACFVILCLLLF